MDFTKDLISVSSSNIHKVGFDLHSQSEFIQFKARSSEPADSGPIYRYIAFPPEMHREFMESPSKGSFFQKRIKGKFACERVA